MKRIGLIFLAMVLALGALGVGYAAWAKTLDIKGTIATGDSSAIFSEQNYDNGFDYANITIAPDPNNSKILKVTVTNAYPGAIFTDVPFTIQNDGTVPIKVTSVDLTDNPNSVLATYSSTSPAGFVDVNAYGYGTFSFSLNTDYNIIDSASNYTFELTLNYTFAAGPW
jgi:hypothetical protein